MGGQHDDIKDQAPVRSSIPNNTIKIKMKASITYQHQPPHHSSAAPHKSAGPQSPPPKYHTNSPSPSYPLRAPSAPKARILVAVVLQSPSSVKTPQNSKLNNPNLHLHLHLDFPPTLTSSKTKKRSYSRLESTYGTTKSKCGVPWGAKSYSCLLAAI